MKRPSVDQTSNASECNGLLDADATIHGIGRVSQPITAMLISVCIHLILLLGMAMILMGGSGQSGVAIKLFVDASHDSAPLDLTQLELTNTSQESQLQQPPETPRLQKVSMSTNLTSLTGQSASSATAQEQSFPSNASGAISEAFAAASAVGSQSDNPQANPGYGEGASFFGVYAPGQRFVFVIDSSKSMLQGTRWPTLRRELIRAIKTLSPDQQFFVISFDAGMHPMFDLYPPKSEFLTPTDQSIYRLNAWLSQIRHGSNTLPASSIGLALKLKPDAIFLLSDGEIRDNTIQELRFYNRKKDESGNEKAAIPIHTLLLHSEIGAIPLKIIADENDGVFTPVSELAAGRR